MNRRLAALLAIAALLATACAGAWGIAVVRAPAGKAGALETAAFVGSFSFPGPGGGRIRAPVEGAVDSRSKRMRLEVDLAGVFPGLLKGGGRIVHIWEGSDLYTQFPETVAHELGGKRWVKLDPAARAALGGFDVRTLLDRAGVGYPRTTLAGLGDEAEKVGTEQIRGVLTTHYRARLPAGEALSALANEPKGTTVALFGDQGLPVDVWVDTEGRPRRLAHELDMSPVPDVPAELKGRVRFEMEVVSTGEPFEAELPPASETAILAHLLDG